MTKTCLAIWMLFSAFAIWGCATAARPPSLAVAIVSPASPPSPAQALAINRVLEEQIAKKGYTPARDVRSADYVMHVRFTPDANNPLRGHLEFIGIEPNRAPVAHRPENAAAEASAHTLAELRKAVLELDALNARSN